MAAHLYELFMHTVPLDENCEALLLDADALIDMELWDAATERCRLAVTYPSVAVKVRVPFV